MAGLDADVSSYKLPAQPSMLDIAGKVNQLESGNLTIDKQKLDLLNQRYQILNKEIVGLAEDPNLSPELIMQRGQNLVKAGLLPPKDFAAFIKDMPTDKSQLPTYVRQASSRALDNAQAVQFHYGQNSMLNTGAGSVPLNQRPGMAPTQSGAIIENQQGPAQLNAPVQLPNAATGTTDTTTQGAFQNRLGISNQAPGVVAPVTPGVKLPVAAPAAQRAPAAIPGQSPELEGSVKALNEDRAMATTKSTALKPLLQVLPLLKDLKTGIGTEQFNQARAAAVNLGLISADEKDPTAIYQVINKKLAGYVANSGLANRSDAGQALSQESSPSAKTQILPALEKLARDAVAQDRVEISRSGAFEGQPNEYSKHRASYPSSVDERAFNIDTLDAPDRVKLIDKFSKIENGKRVSTGTAEADKFWKSLAIAKKQGLLNAVQ